ncbi:heavy-metal-associated domain-containing protein [Chlorogloeopsis sp. ULAP01]|jgi:copper chaperone|uniref:heavy-metal-associated domain-containing protein n=1 Tax=Chlorogloeopsis sp. ULAP01 TaxID=3056483 RepID=UPI0025AA8DE1|nr:heavy-metal-associated domain-containing protein [Chlorogloeopsis sp. ULAP01]MDM9384697.1 heavy-metal-associated domain-containing protein [Chlorogloeopsis sp. ULAP01]
MKVQFLVPKMACSACVETITKAIQTIDATATVQANSKTKVVSVETQASETVIKQAIAAVGYPTA